MYFILKLIKKLLFIYYYLKFYIDGFTSFIWCFNDNIGNIVSSLPEPVPACRVGAAELQITTLPEPFLHPGLPGFWMDRIAL